ncbi:MAG: hypothetical protein CM15mP78_11940 [Candidatus Poseidoniales archaeon]|nr:MAG: hypothetical protein CM15mP78_11940 [Candidatus Poseidoniales archaeon]
MERNGLPDRLREAKIGRWVLGVCGFLLVSFFLAPMTLETGSVGPLQGRANAIDFYSEDGFGSYGNQAAGEDVENGQCCPAFAWSEVNPYAAIIYGFGDVNCHQKSERSWEVNNNQLPVCTRDVGIFAGLFIGGVVFSRRGLESMDGSRHLPLLASGVHAPRRLCKEPTDGAVVGLRPLAVPAPHR